MQVNLKAFVDKGEFASQPPPYTTLILNILKSHPQYRQTI